MPPPLIFALLVVFLPSFLLVRSNTIIPTESASPAPSSNPETAKLTPPPITVRNDRCISNGPLNRISLMCFLREWTPDPEPLKPFKRSNIVQLRLKIWGRTSRLTSQHLEKFDRLVSLSVVGTCHDPFPFRTSGFCANSSGISEVDSEAFRGVPQLRSLFLVTHPLVRLENLQHLSRLSRLLLQSMSHLNYILPSALNPIRSSIEYMQLLDNNVSRLSAWMFRNMTRLKALHWVGAFTFMGTECLADLPRLESVVLRVRTSSMTIGQTGPTLQPFALTRLPRLKEFLLHNLDHKEEKRTISATPQPPQSVCNLTGSELQTVHATVVHVALLNLCKGMFSCPSCGEDPIGRPQRILLYRIYGASREALALQDLFPTSLGQLNVTELVLIATKVNQITDELARMPFLRRLNFHRGVFAQSISHLNDLRVGNIHQLTVNPFKYLRSPNILSSVRIIVNICDCITLEVIDWFVAMGKEKVLLLGCENLKCSCNIPTKDSMPIGDNSMPWQSMNVVAHLLRGLCGKPRAPHNFYDSEVMCRAKCQALTEMRLVVPSRGPGILSWAWVNLFGPLLVCWALSGVS